MFKPTIVTGLFVALGIGAMLVPVAARSVGGSGQAAHVPSHGTPPQSHRTNRYYFYAPYYYRDYGNYGSAESYAPPPPPAEKPAADVRRECEPKDYTVPAADGGESKVVTIVRC